MKFVEYMYIIKAEWEVF